MNLKNKAIAYVKFIFPRSLLPYKSARAVTDSEVNGTSEFKIFNALQRNLVDTFQVELRGVICPLILVIGTAFITSFVNGALKMFSRKSCKRWLKTR